MIPVEFLMGFHWQYLTISFVNTTKDGNWWKFSINFILFSNPIWKWYTHIIINMMKLLCHLVSIYFTFLCTILCKIVSENLSSFKQEKIETSEFSFTRHYQKHIVTWMYSFWLTRRWLWTKPYSSNLRIKRVFLADLYHFHTELWIVITHYE